MTRSMRGTALALLLSGTIVTGTNSVAEDGVGDLGIYAADPSVIATEHGYIAVESRRGHSLFVRVAPTISELAEAKAVRVWSDKQGLREVWAPEIVFRDDRYEIYFAAGAGSQHRMYAIQSLQPAADYGEAEELLLPDNKWAIDGLPFTFSGKDYFVWSGWQGDTDVQQDIYVAQVDADGRVLAPRVRIASPDQHWENVAGQRPTINEAPQPIVDPAGQLHVAYSANGSWGENYCIADLRLQKGGDPLDSDDWFKSDGCLFGANPESLAPEGTRATASKGVGHHSFVLANGDIGDTRADDWMPFLFHGVPAQEEPSNFWAARKWHLGTFRWIPDIEYVAGDKSDSGWSIAFRE